MASTFALTNGKGTRTHDGDRDWVVLPHGKLERLAENLWWTWGSIPRMSRRRSMVVARRTDGKLVVHDAIALDEAKMADLESLGRIAYLVVPNARPRLDAAAYKQRFPRAQVFAPRGARAAVERGVKVDGIYEDFPADDAVRFEMLHGIADAEGAMIVRSSDGVTVVLNDAVSHMDRKPDAVGSFFAKLLGPASGPRVSRLLRLLSVRDRKALREDLERYAEHPELVRLVVAHGKVACGPAAAQALRQAATYL